MGGALNFGVNMSLNHNGSERSRVLHELVLGIHRRNGGTEHEMDPGAPLIGGALGLNSLDLAEVVVVIERRFGLVLFGQGRHPENWQDVLDIIDGIDPEVRKGGEL